MSTPDERDQRLVRPSSFRMQEEQSEESDAPPLPPGAAPRADSVPTKLEDGNRRPLETRHTTGMTDATAATSNSGQRSTTHPHRRHHKVVERLPCLCSPSEDPNGPWLKEGTQQSTWFSLFYGG